jgi:hypothetical protein
MVGVLPSYNKCNKYLCQLRPLLFFKELYNRRFMPSCEPHDPPPCPPSVRSRLAPLSASSPSRRPVCHSSQAWLQHVDAAAGRGPGCGGTGRGGGRVAVGCGGAGAAAGSIMKACQPCDIVLYRCLLLLLAAGKILTAARDRGPAARYKARAAAAARARATQRNARERRNAAALVTLATGVLLNA